MNIYECRFVKDNDKAVHILQYGNSEEEIDTFWNKWWFEHYSTNPSCGKYVDCKLSQEDVDFNYTDKKMIENIENSVFVKSQNK